MEIIKVDEGEKIPQTTIPKNENESFFDKIKTYIIVYRNNRDVVFTLYSALWFFFCTYVVCLANSYADRTNTNVINDSDNDYVAPDVILKPTHQFYLENQWIPRDIADILVRATSGLIILRALTLKCYSLTVARRILLVMGFVYLLRACVIPLTVLPTPWVTCKKNYYDNIFYDALLLELQVRVACGDVFFSGHTIMFTLNIMEYWYYCKYTWINILVTIFNVVGMFTLVMSSYHYSIDVVCGFIFSSMSWIIYHWAINIPQLGGSWWGTIINWIDDPFYYERDALPVAYDQNGAIQGNISDVANMSNMQKFEVSDNMKDFEQGHSVSPVNEITLLYEMNKEHQRKISSQNKQNIISDDEDADLTEEEKIYKRKSVLSDTSIDNISNVNLSVHGLNPSLQNEEIYKKEKFLSPTFGSKVYKHHSLTSLSSNNSENNNVPNLLIRNSSNNLSIASSSSSNNNICLGNPLTQSPTMSPVSSPLLSADNKNKNDRQNGSMDSYYSINSKNSKSIIPEQSISPIPPVYQPSEGINVSNNNTNGVTQFKKNISEALVVDSVSDSK